MQNKVYRLKYKFMTKPRRFNLTILNMRDTLSGSLFTKQTYNSKKTQ